MHSQIEQIAYQIWEDEGRPDGEQYIDFGPKKIKLKDYHWYLAELECGFVLDKDACNKAIDSNLTRHVNGFTIGNCIPKAIRDGIINNFQHRFATVSSFNIHDCILQYFETDYSYSDLPMDLYDLDMSHIGVTISGFLWNGSNLYPGDPIEIWTWVENDKQRIHVVKQ